MFPIVDALCDNVCVCVIVLQMRRNCQLHMRTCFRSLTQCVTMCVCHCASNAEKLPTAHANMFSIVDAMCDNECVSLRFKCEESANCTCEHVFDRWRMGDARFLNSRSLTTTTTTTTTTTSTTLQTADGADARSIHGVHHVLHGLAPHVTDSGDGREAGVHGRLDPLLEDVQCLLPPAG